MLGEKQDKVGTSLTAAESQNSETEETPRDNLSASCASQTTANCKFINP